MFPCLNLLELAQLSVSRVLAPGGLAVDATAGNGFDTLFLARQVGEAGLVAAFEIQAQGLANTGALLREHGLARRVRLLAVGHEHMAAQVELFKEEDKRRQPGAIMFNLGFLPGSDKQIKTRPATTLAALEQAVGLLSAGGIITVHCYNGHAGGQEEGDAVLEWARALDAKRFRVYGYQALNKRRGPEQLLLIGRRVAREARHPSL